MSESIKTHQPKLLSEFIQKNSFFQKKEHFWRIHLIK